MLDTNTTLTSYDVVPYPGKPFWKITCLIPMETDNMNRLTILSTVMATICVISCAMEDYATKSKSPAAATNLGTNRAFTMPATSNKATTIASRSAMTNEQRMAELLQYFSDNGFPLERDSRHRYIIEKNNVGGMVSVGIHILPLDSDDKVNEDNYARRPGYALPSVYNPHCKMAMFLPQFHGGGSLEAYANCRGKDSKFVKLFLAFNPENKSAPTVASTQSSNPHTQPAVP